MRGWRVKAGVAFGLVACGGVAWFAVHYVVQARDRGTAGTVAQGLAAVLVPVAGLAVWLVRQFRQGVPPIDLAQAADDLAGRVGRQWRDAELQRGLSYRALAVRWTWSSRGLSGPPGDAVGDARRPRMAPLPGCSRITRRELARGDLSELFQVYGGLDSGRIVLAGAPGAGKSGAMIRLLLDAVKHREGIGEPAVRAKVPVPVLLTAYDWLPGRDGLADWVTRRLEDEHPFLKVRIGTVSAARALVDGGAVSILLDGADEMPEEARAAMLRQIGQQARHRVVVSSRTSELESAVDGGHLDGAAALELAAITPAEAADYLQSRTVHPAPAPWRTLIQHLREDETSPVAQALDSPLMLSLLLDTYLPSEPAGELTDPGRFPGRQQIEDHLLARILPSAYTPRPGSPAPSCTPWQARQWLGYLAAQMKQTGTRDLAWWRIPQWLPPRHLKISVGLASGITAGLASGITGGLTFGFMFGPMAGLASGLVFGPTAGLAFGLEAGLLTGRKITLRSGLAIGLAFGVRGRPRGRNPRRAQARAEDRARQRAHTRTHRRTDSRAHRWTHVRADDRPGYDGLQRIPAAVPQAEGKKPAASRRHRGSTHVRACARAGARSRIRARCPIRDRSQVRTRNRAGGRHRERSRERADERADPSSQHLDAHRQTDHSR
jgi:hypothetical protein